MQKLNITKRGAETGGKIPTSMSSFGKKDKVAKISIPLSAILIADDEIGVLMNDPDSHSALFTGARSKHLEPRWQGIDPIPITDKFKDAKVTIKMNDSTAAVILKPCTVGQITVKPLTGGLCEMACVVTGVPDEHLQVLTMLGKKCTVSILNGTMIAKDDGQRELPLHGGIANLEGGDEEDEGDEEGEGETVYPDDDAPTLADVQREEDDATAEATRGAAGKKVTPIKDRKPRKSRDPI